MEYPLAPAAGPRRASAAPDSKFAKFSLRWSGVAPRCAQRHRTSKVPRGLVRRAARRLSLVVRRRLGEAVHELGELRDGFLVRLRRAAVELVRHKDADDCEAG